MMLQTGTIDCVVADGTLMEYDLLDGDINRLKREMDYTVFWLNNNLGCFPDLEQSIRLIPNDINSEI